MAVSISEYEKALKALQQALQCPRTEMNRDASIQRFEFVVELAWKTARKVMGTQTTAPKEIVREMARNGLIQNPEFWFEAIEVRNLTSHTYNEDQAEKTYQFIFSFYPEAEKLLMQFKKQ